MKRIKKISFVVGGLLLIYALAKMSQSEVLIYELTAFAVYGGCLGFVLGYVYDKIFYK